MINILSVIELAVQFGPAVKAILDEASSNAGIVQKITALSPTLASLAEGLGAELFPNAAPTLHVVGGVIAAFDPNTTKWLQGALNALVAPVPPLVVDGSYGPKTTAAVEALQTKLGLTVDGLAGSITQAAIQAALAKLPTL
jgi:murein L,D-transpeptidase YcbB/YkuD